MYPKYRSTYLPDLLQQFTLLPKVVFYYFSFIVFQSLLLLCWLVGFKAYRKAYRFFFLWNVSTLPNPGYTFFWTYSENLSFWRIKYTGFSLFAFWVLSIWTVKIFTFCKAKDFLNVRSAILVCTCGSCKIHCICGVLGTLYLQPVWGHSIYFFLFLLVFWKLD